jgi:hypothetical protein
MVYRSVIGAATPPERGDEEWIRNQHVHPMFRDAVNLFSASMPTQPSIPCPSCDGDGTVKDREDGAREPTCPGCHGEKVVDPTRVLWRISHRGGGASSKWLFWTTAIALIVVLMNR